MKELAGTAVNFCLLEGEKEPLIPMAEIIFVLSEPQYQPDGGGGLARIRSTEVVRFSVGLKPLKGLIKTLQEYEEEMIALKDRVKPTEGENDE